MNYQIQRISFVLNVQEHKGLTGNSKSLECIELFSNLWPFKREETETPLYFVGQLRVYPGNAKEGITNSSQSWTNIFLKGQKCKCIIGKKKRQYSESIDNFIPEQHIYIHLKSWILHLNCSLWVYWGKLNSKDLFCPGNKIFNLSLPIAGVNNNTKFPNCKAMWLIYNISGRVTEYLYELSQAPSWCHSAQQTGPCQTQEHPSQPGS